MLPEPVPAPAERSPFLPLLLIGIGLLLWSGATLLQLVNDRSAVKTALDNQSQTHASAQKLRVQLDAIAAGTQRLADAGNANARLIVEELRKRGVTINPDATPGTQTRQGPDSK